MPRKHRDDGSNPFRPSQTLLRRFGLLRFGLFGFRPSGLHCFPGAFAALLGGHAGGSRRATFLAALSAKGHGSRVFPAHVLELYVTAMANARLNTLTGGMVLVRHHA